MQVDLRNGDCLELMKDIPDGSVDLVVTDPPYKFENQGGGFYAKNSSTQRVYCDALKKINCCDFNPYDFLTAVKPKLKKFYGYFFCNKSLLEDYIKFARDNELNFDVLVMAKSNPIPSYNNHHLSDLEYIVMMRDKGTYFSKHKNLDDFRKFYITSCKKGVHPAEKPVDLLERFIRVSSRENDVILDPFMGSGSTGVACINTTRSFIGIELDEQYFNIAEQRISEAKSMWLDKLLRVEIV